MAILCFGQVDEFYAKPMLVLEKRAQQKPLEEMISTDAW
jgi:hypothetical protein